MSELNGKKTIDGCRIEKEKGALDLPETRRVEALSDAAFSIIITLLVLEIHRPAGVLGRLGEELVAEWSSYLAYAVAFIYVGVIWLNHHYMFDRLCKGRSTPQLDQSGHYRHGGFDPVSDGRACRRIPRWQSYGSKSGRGALRLDRRADVGRVVAGLCASVPSR